MDDSELVINENNSRDKAIVCFGGFALKMGGIAPYDFLHFLSNNFKNADKYFYRDIKQMCYHKGIDKLSTDIESTVLYLSKIVEKYKRVIFTGNSAGAYAAILYGSLLNVSDVIVFKPITILYGRKNLYNLRYIDLSKDVINNTTKYYLIGDDSITDVNDLHHKKHCENICSYPNVKIVYKKGLDLKEMKESGELYNVYNSII
jgi:uncharacterized protein YsxB (DUF464 family)